MRASPILLSVLLGVTTCWTSSLAMGAPPSRPSAVVTLVAGDWTGRSLGTGGLPFIDEAKPFAGNGGPAKRASLGMARAVALDGAGNLFITGNVGANPPSRSCQVREVLAATGTIEAVAGRGLASARGGRTPAQRVWLNGCEGIVAAPKGAIYFVRITLWSSVVDEVNLTTGHLRRVAGATRPIGLGDGGPATRAYLYGASALAIDRHGDLFIADTDHNRVREVKTGGVIITVAGDGRAGFSGDGGPARRAQLYLPTGVAVDREGDVFIADDENGRVREVVAASGVIRTVAGGGRYPHRDFYRFRGEGGLATRAHLGRVLDVAVDGSDNLFLAAGPGILEVVHTSGRIYTIAGNGKLPATPGQYKRQLLTLPARAVAVPAVGLALDRHGEIYFADGYSDLVRKVIPMTGRDTTSYLAAVTFPTPRVGRAAGGDFIAATTDGGASWRRQYTGSGEFGELDIADRAHRWAVGRAELLRTSDGGKRWTRAEQD